MSELDTDCLAEVQAGKQLFSEVHFQRRVLMMVLKTRQQTKIGVAYAKPTWPNEDATEIQF